MVGNESEEPTTGSSRVEDRPDHDSEDQQTDESTTPLTPEERARLLAELEAELEAAERSIREEGTITTEEFLKQRAEYPREPTDSGSSKAIGSFTSCAAQLRR